MVETAIEAAAAITRAGGRRRQVEVTFESAGVSVYVWLAADDVRRTIDKPAAVHGVVDEIAGIGETRLAQGLSDRPPG